MMVKGWNDITLYQYQQIERINSRNDLDEVGRTLLSVCALFNMTEYELDQAGVKVADKLCKRLANIFTQPLEPVPCKSIGRYLINYDPDDLRTGQYVELMYFMDTKNPILNAHYILSSISQTEYSLNNSKEHKLKSAYFQSQRITKVPGTLAQFIENFSAFNNEFKPLFGLDEKVNGEKAIVDPFNRRYGWTFSVKQVADYKGVSLDEAYDIPAREFLNHLSYLKALDKYMVEQSKPS